MLSLLACTGIFETVCRPTGSYHVTEKRQKNHFDFIQHFHSTWGRFFLATLEWTKREECWTRSLTNMSKLLSVLYLQRIGWRSGCYLRWAAAQAVTNFEEFITPDWLKMRCRSSRRQKYQRGPSKMLSRTTWSGWHRLVLTQTSQWSWSSPCLVLWFMVMVEPAWCLVSRAGIPFSLASNWNAWE